MADNKGGRGIKAKYPTKTMRVPERLEVLVSELTQLLYEGLFDEYQSLDINALTNYFEYVDLDHPVRLDKTESIAQARQVLNQKKSAKLSVEKLLQVLLSDNEIKL